MKIQNLTFNNDEEVTNFLMMYIPHRINYIDSKDKHTVGEILGECWYQYAPEERPKIERIFALLVEAGELSVFPSGQSPDRKQLYTLRPITLH